MTASKLAAAPEDQRYEILRQHLLPIIMDKYPALGVRIVKILLELDCSELLHMLKNNISLQNKVDLVVKLIQHRSAE